VAAWAAAVEAAAAVAVVEAAWVTPTEVERMVSWVGMVNATAMVWAAIEVKAGVVCQAGALAVEEA
jgi:hypothetical protein